MAARCAVRATLTHRPPANAGYQRWLSTRVLQVSLVALVLNQGCAVALPMGGSHGSLSPVKTRLCRGRVTGCHGHSLGGTSIAGKTPGPIDFWILVELMLFRSEQPLRFLTFFAVFFRLSVNQITDSGVKVLCEELPKYKILTFLGYVFLKNTATAI